MPYISYVKLRIIFHHLHGLKVINSFLLLYSEFNTAVDIRLHKWADSLSLGKLCAEVSPQ